MPEITLNIWNKINKFIKENKLINQRDRVLVAVSGGPDSMVLLDYFNKRFKNRFIVFHLNHGIRKESIIDENVVRNYCVKNGIDFFCEKIDAICIANKNRDNLENTARKKRYEFFLKYAKKYKCDLVATAHNMDENIETIMLNLIRGKSIKGLCGIPFKRKLSRNIYVIRPLICIKKNEILSYLKENKIKYAVDKTNYDTNYTRNWIRRKLIPMIESKQPNFGIHLIDISKQIIKFTKSGEQTAYGSRLTAHGYKKVKR